MINGVHDMFGGRRISLSKICQKAWIGGIISLMGDEEIGQSTLGRRTHLFKIDCTVVGVKDMKERNVS